MEMCKHRRSWRLLARQIIAQVFTHHHHQYPALTLWWADLQQQTSRCKKNVLSHTSTFFCGGLVRCLLFAGGPADCVECPRQMFGRQMLSWRRRRGLWGEVAREETTRAMRTSSCMRTEWEIASRCRGWRAGQPRLCRGQSLGGLMKEQFVYLFTA